MKDNSVDLTLTDILYDGVNRKSNGLRSLDKGKADVLTFDLHSFENEVLFDLCTGGTHLYLGSLLNRKVIGSELNEEYFKIIKDRFKGED